MGWVSELLFGDMGKSQIEEPTGGSTPSYWWGPAEQARINNDAGDQSAERFF